MTVHQSAPSSFGEISAEDAFAAIEPPQRDWIETDGLQRGVAGPPEWSEIAFIAMCTRRGVEPRLRVTDASLEADGSILLAGQGDYDGSAAAVFARFTVPASGQYSCAVRLQRAQGQFVGGCTLRLNQTVLGTVTPAAGASSVHTFVVQLGAGQHGFGIILPNADIRFYSLKIFTAPVLGQA